jgi:hypothetical protein
MDDGREWTLTDEALDFHEPFAILNFKNRLV